MAEQDIHRCSYYCQLPECIMRQRDELRQMYVEISDPNLIEDETPFDPLAMVTVSDTDKPTTLEQLLKNLIEVQGELTNVIADMAMSNYALAQAMAGDDEDDQSDPMSRYQTLGGEEP